MLAKDGLIKNIVHSDALRSFLFHLSFTIKIDYFIDFTFINIQTMNMPVTLMKYIELRK